MSRRNRALWLLALLLPLLAGCAGGRSQPAGEANSAAAAAAPSAVPPAGPTVRRLTDGREGFIISEYPGSDADLRADFAEAVRLLQDGAYAPAIPLLEGVIERSPDVSAPFINLAIACLHLGKTAEAEAHLKNALNLVPGHPLASNAYGLLLRRQGRFAEARAAYENALAVFPDYLPVRRNLGILCDLYLHDRVCALDQYEFYSAAVPADDQVQLWVADLRARSSQ